MNLEQRKQQYENFKNILDEEKSSFHKNEDSLTAPRLRALLNSCNITNAYKEDALTALTGEEFPQEIIFAMNIIPVNGQAIGAMFARSNTGLIQQCFRKLDKYGFSKDMCSNVRSAFGVTYADILPTPNLVFGNSAPCDGFTKLTYYISEVYGSKFMFLDTPDRLNKENIQYLAGQIEDSIQEITDNFEIDWDVMMMLRAIRYSNQAKNYFFKTMELTKEHQLREVQRELYELVVTNLWGMKELVPITKKLYQEALQLANQQKEKKKRILWVGQVPNYAYDLMNYIYENVDVVYFATFVDGIQTLLDENNPYESMAERLIKFSWDPDRRSQVIINVCKEYHVDGIVLQNPWGCRNLLGCCSILRDILIKNKIKCLSIDSDFMDQDKLAISQVINRFAAFFEII